MSLDVKLPIGAFFAMLGSTVMVYGLSNSYPIEVHWGGAMMLGGAVLSALALRALHEKRKAVAFAPAKPSAKGG